MPRLDLPASYPLISMLLLMSACGVDPSVETGALGPSGDYDVETAELGATDEGAPSGVSPTGSSPEAPDVSPTVSSPKAPDVSPTVSSPKAPAKVEVADVLSLLRGDGKEFETQARVVVAEQTANVELAAQIDEGPAGSCCPNNDCVCRGGAPSRATIERNGPFGYASYSSGFGSFSSSGYGGGTIFYPKDAQAPFSGVVMCPGFTATKDSIAPWGPFFASHGIVLLVIDTITVLDQVIQRQDELLAALEVLKKENTRMGSPLLGKMSPNRYGLSGWSMGGGGTWLATADHPELKSAVTLAGHNLTAFGGLGSAGSRVPTLMMNGATDVTFLGGLGQSEDAYDAIPNSTPKLLYVMAYDGHFSWGTPTTNGNASGRYMMAWQKTFLEGDLRYRQFLLEKGPNASTWQSNLR